MNLDGTKIEFLTSTRFWALVLGDIALMLRDPSITVDSWYVTAGKFLAVLAAGFISIRTVDRFSENVGS